MAIELKIKWDGTASGLAENRLSLSAFGASLPLLLGGLRRIASNIVRDAMDEKQATTGRLAKAANQLDIEITDLVKGSTGFQSVVSVNTPSGATFPLFDLAERAGYGLLEALDAEGHGIPKNLPIRRFLASLPQGITEQAYSLYQNGSVLREVILRDAVLPEIPAEVPYLVQYLGSVVGVGFPPGKAEVKIKAESGSTATLVATAEQVETALQLRQSDVIALGVVHDGSHRLLNLRDAKEEPKPFVRESAIYGRWQGVLKRLAQ
ncbi:MAG: hypothetical protein IVW54_03785 [Candidatus Binataceae bacterium]|nr:hypothetical protein [Candidatus Binataceae bacterium]